MLDYNLFSYAQGRRANELKPLVAAFSDVVSRHRYIHTERKSSDQPASVAPLYVAECGVWKGDSLLLCLKVAQDLGVPVNFFGLDTFSGLPELGTRDLATAREGAPYRFKRWFADTSLESVEARVREAGFADRVQFLSGLFSETLPSLPNVNFCFVNIDCDLYEGHVECLEYFFPRMMPGGIIYFDDYHSEDFPMARLAIDEFLAAHSEVELIHIRFGDHSANAMKSMIVVR